MTETELRNKVVAAAKAWLGCKVSDGSHRKIIDLYNSHTPLARGYKVTYSDPWCATFASAAAIQCGMTDIMPTECSCSNMIALYKALSRWVENDAYVPAPGDLIMYDWDDSGQGDCTGAPEHVGIVTSVSGSTITVIEGNKSNAVGYRTMQVNGRYIRGYCTPDYAGKAKSLAVTATTTTTNKNEEDDDMTIYKTLADVPSSYKDSIQKVVDKGALKGTGNGALNVSEDLCRTLTILDRLGKLD